MNDFCESVRYAIEEGYITLSNDNLKNCSDAIENMLSSNDISISMAGQWLVKAVNGWSRLSMVGQGCQWLVNGWSRLSMAGK